MEHTMIRLPAHYASLEQDELVYVEGGWLSDQQAEVLLWGASMLVASVTLMPNVYLYILDPVLSPITSKVDDIANNVGSFFSSLFKSFFG